MSLLQEMTGKLRETEGKVKEEKVRVEAVRKEGADQLKASKTEIKSLTDKIEKYVISDSMWRRVEWL